MSEMSFQHKKKLSGAAYKKIKEQKRKDNEGSAIFMQKFVKIGKEDEITELVENSSILSNCSDEEEIPTKSPQPQASTSRLPETEEKHEKQTTANDFRIETEMASSGDPLINYNNPTTWNIAEKKCLDLLVENGPTYGDNLNIYPSTNNRQFSKKYFQKVLPNGSAIRRSWLFYCLERDVIYCFPCLLFGSKNTQFSTAEVGFNDWHNTGARILHHENSIFHKKCVIHLRTFQTNLSEKHFITDELQKVIESETEKWKHILKCILDAILFCIKNGEPLRGSVEEIGHPNSGKFLQTIELISHYDPIIKQHIESKKSTIKYFSPKIQNELIAVVGTAVKNEIIFKIKSAKYYTIILDTTPDVSHMEQLSLVIRYVEKNNNTCTIEERFIEFLEVKEKTGEALTDVIEKKLTSLGLDIQNIRGQAYDNGANMVGRYKGLKSRILQRNPYAKFVPCCAHSLNLVALHSASVNTEIITFFGAIQNLFNFFVHSTVRWDKLKNTLKISLKGFSDTRWSSKALALKALVSQFKDVLKMLEEMTNTSVFSEDTVSGAKNFLNVLSKFNFIILLVFWSELLEKINKINLLLQKKDITVDIASRHIKGLLEEIKNSRNDCFEKSEKLAKDICLGCDVPAEYQEVRKRKIKKMPGELSSDSNVTPDVNLRRILYQVIDSISFELNNRYTNLNEISSDFEFLDGASLSKLDINTLKSYIKDLCVKYPNDLDVVDFIQEAESFTFQAIELFNLEKLSMFQIYQNLIKFDLLSEYPNFSISIQIFLTLPVTSASCERSFSKLKLIKNYLRSSMSQERLSHAALISIERTITESISFTTYLSDFAQQKARKVQF